MDYEILARQQLDLDQTEARGYYIPAAGVRCTFRGLIDALEKLGHVRGSPVMAMVQTAERDILTMSHFLFSGEK